MAPPPKPTTPLTRFRALLPSFPPLRAPNPSKQAHSLARKSKGLLRSRARACRREENIRQRRELGLLPIALRRRGGESRSLTAEEPGVFFRGRGEGDGDVGGGGVGTGGGNSGSGSETGTGTSTRSRSQLESTSEAPHFAATTTQLETAPPLPPSDLDPLPVPTATTVAALPDSRPSFSHPRASSSPSPSLPPPPQRQQNRKARSKPTPSSDAVNRCRSDGPARAAIVRKGVKRVGAAASSSSLSSASPAAAAAVSPAAAESKGSRPEGREKGPASPAAGTGGLVKAGGPLALTRVGTDEMVGGWPWSTEAWYRRGHTYRN